MVSSESLSFMNTYHTEKHDSTDYSYSDILKDFDEHLKTTKQTGKSPIKKFTKSNITMSNIEYNNIIGDDILTPSEDMLNNRFNKFTRYGYLDPANELITGTREYLFFSKPDLHLVDVINSNDDNHINQALKNCPFFDEAFRRYKLSYYSLQQTFRTHPIDGIYDFDGLIIDLNSKYIPLLSNMVTSSLDLPDITANDVTNNQNLYQVNTSYREGSLMSDLQYDFSLEFKDTKYLDVYMLFKIYDEYFKQKYMAEILPTKMDYIFNKIYPEALSIWKVITDDTGRIIYWAKATGCTPMSVPRASISNIDGNIKFTVNWKAQFIRDMDPVNLNELNYLTSMSLGLGHNIGKDIMTGIAQRTYVVTDVVNFKSNEGYSNMNGPTWVGYPMIISNNTRSPLRTGHLTTNPAKSGFHKLVWVNKKY